MSDGRRLRILHLTAGSDAGGLSRYVADLCGAMAAGGHEVAVAGQRGVSQELFEGAGYPWIDAPLKGGPLALRRAAGELGEYLQGHPVDILHCHYRRPVLVARRLQRRFKIPILYTVHQPGINVSGVMRWLSDFGDHCHVASDEARQWLIEVVRYPFENITVIPHGIDPVKFPVRDGAAKESARRELGLPANGPVAAFVGRFDVPKNPMWIVDFALAAREAIPELHTVMVGDGPEEMEVRARIAELGLGDRVHLTGYGDPLAAYQAADALLIPSLREGFSLVCAEAMAVGAPVIRTRTGGCAEMIIEGQTGRSTAIGREAFVASAVEFMKDDGALARMGSAAASHIRAHFTFDRQLSQTVELYWRLVRQAEAKRV